MKTVAFLGVVLCLASVALLIGGCSQKPQSVSPELPMFAKLGKVHTGYYDFQQFVEANRE